MTTEDVMKLNIVKREVPFQFVVPNGAFVVVMGIGYYRYEPRFWHYLKYTDGTVVPSPR